MPATAIPPRPGVAARRAARRLRQLAGVALGTMLAVGTAGAQKKVKVNFSPTGKVFESNGKRYIVATPSGFTDAQKALTIKVIQDNYDDALGKGKVEVSEGSGGDREVIVTNSRVGKNVAGESGERSGPSIASSGAFARRGLAGDDLARAVGETAAHEVGHRFGLPDNYNKSYDKMTEGVPDTIRKLGKRHFNDKDKATLQKNVSLSDPTPLGPRGPLDGLGIRVGTTLAQVPPGVVLDDDYLTASALFSGASGAEFGYISRTGEFVFQGTAAEPTLMTFWLDGREDVAARVGTSLFSLALGGASFALSDPNPFAAGVFRTATITFATPGGPSVLTLDSAIEPRTGGFRASTIPEPSAVVLVGVGLIAVLGATRRAAGRRA